MTESTLQLQIPVILPHLEDECAQCIERLNEQISAQKGIYRAHVERQTDDGSGLVCLHYDPNLLTLERVQNLAEQAGARVARRYHHQTLHVTGMDCADCARSIEHVLNRVPGVIAASVSYAAERVRLEYDGSQVSYADLVQRIRWLGYEVQEPDRTSWVAANRDLLFAGLSGLFLALGFLGERVFALPLYATIPLYSLGYLAGGFEPAYHGIKAALRLRFDIDFLMVVAAIGAAALGNWAEGGLLLFLFSLGHGLEHYAMGRARHAIHALGELAPKTARVRREGAERDLSVKDLLRGDVVVVAPGERFPIDGTVLMGTSAVDQSPITGESLPVPKSAGDAVFAGSVNGDGALEIEVTRLADDTTLARVVRLVEEAETQKSPTQQFTERITRVFVPSVLGLVVLAVVIPPVLGWLPWQTALLRGLTVLVAASPCALAIATPAAVLSGVAQAARNGVLIKGGMHLENLGNLQTMAFDKTGTLTTGRPEVTDVIELEARDGGGAATAEQLLALAAAVESRSAHPLAQAIGRRADALGLGRPAVGHVQSLNGRGLSAEVGGMQVSIGSLKLFDGEEDAVPSEVVERVAEFEAQGKTTVVVKLAARYAGIIAVADRPRPAAHEVIARLRSLGVDELIMLTGDNRLVADAVASEVGMTGVEAELMPEEKLRVIKRLAGKGRGRVAMVGDGVNDAPALAAATVGIAMGAGGSAAALETADVALMGDDLTRLPFVIGLSRESNRIIRQNLLIALGVIALLIPSALLGIATIGPAILLHEGSTVGVVLNALRLLGYRQERGRA